MQRLAPASGKRQARVQPDVLRCGHPVLPVNQMLVRLTSAPDLGAGVIAAQNGGAALAALDYSTVCRRQKSLDVRVHYHSQAATACACLPTPAASSFLGEGEWKTKKHGAERRRQWRKVHLGIDAENMQIRAIVVTTNEVGDSPVATELVTQIPSHEPIVSFTGDVGV